MDQSLINLTTIMILLPLAGSLIAGLLGSRIGRNATHWTVNILVGISFVISLYLVKVIILGDHSAIDTTLYTWATSGSIQFNVGLLIDRLSVTMASIVLFISFMVHIYTVGYMADDPGYTRFFSYVSLFTFAMLALVLANNFLVLFFGWEGVGLVSYLLIGFWFNRESANAGSLKAFIANRIGDFGFVLAIALVLMHFGTLSYQTVFTDAPQVAQQTMNLLPNSPVSVITVICILLFIGAMGKSAQVPLHIWLPESMEGPTPISALIHAATMVTAGIYMVARMSPLFEYSPLALSVVLIIGATTCLFLGLIAVFEFDIKRVIAYSTISQLGYMAVALGVSAYDAAIFHLITHAFFKALLFLAAGSVIIALHHEQDMRKMGGLATYLPVTYFTFVIGCLAISAIPPFSGFYSKDVIIEATRLSTLPGASYAYFCVMAGAFITPLYSFRALFLTFHTESRVDPKLLEHVHESRWVILIPLILLAIPSVIAGQMLIGTMLFQHPKLLGDTIFILPQHDVLAQLGNEYTGAKAMALDAGRTLPFWLALAGIFTAWVFNAGFPQWASALKRRFSLFYKIMQRKYGFDDFNRVVLVDGTLDLGHVFYDVSDVKMIDGVAVNGSAKLINKFAMLARRLQTGYLYHYALSMVIGLLVFLFWFIGGF